MFYMNYADNMCQRMLLLFLLTELFVSLGSRQQRISTVLWPLGEAAMATKFSGMPAFLTDKNNPAGYCVQGAIEFGMDSRRLIQRCTKPDAKEFKKIAVACAIGFSIMGFIGYTVKLVFIPINNIIVGGS